MRNHLLVVLGLSLGCGSFDDSSAGERGQDDRRSELVGPIATAPAAHFCKKWGIFPYAEILPSIVLDPAVDYLAVASGTSPTDKTVKAVAERGTRCARARDKEACETSFRTLNLSASDNLTTVFTRGDEVGTITTRERALEIVGGAVHNVDEAMWIASVPIPFHLTCDKDASQARGTIIDDGFDVVVGTDICNVRRHAVVFHVTRDGVVTERQRTELASRGGCQ